MLRYALMIITFFLLSCKGVNVDEECENFSCDTIEPESTTIQISFTRNSLNPNPIIYVGKGFWESHSVLKIVNTDTIEKYLFKVSVKVAVNNHFVVYAKYLKGTDTIVVIDGKYVEKKRYHECGYDCWEVLNRNFNINLR